MGVADRFFEPPAVDAEKVGARLARQPEAVQQALMRASAAQEANDFQTARRQLDVALAAAPRDPDVLRMHGALAALEGNHQVADASFEAALQAVPDDAVTFWQYARACEDRGDVAKALALRTRAIEQAPQSPLAWEDLGEHLFTHATAAAALLPLEKAVELAPRFEPGLLKLGYVHVANGRAEDGARCFRAALEANPHFVPAWAALVDIKTVDLTVAEIERMRGLLREGAPLLPGERIALEYALVAACEASGEYREAWERACHANAQRKRELPEWDRAGFAAQERQAEEVFGKPHATAAAPDLGSEVIFIVGLPRSGSTLVEQILASHPDVRGAGELPALPNVLADESRRRQQRYPGWVPEASAEDWQRMGEKYLAATRAFRSTRAHSTDKLPNNWRAIGAIRAMLPAARIVVCRRDPLENCWSCFKQYFLHGWAYANDIEDLASYWQAFDRAATHWAAESPAHVRQQSYEQLTTDPEPQIRALLDFCGLPFDPACLQPHALHRSVHTLSAAQVRKPIYPSRSLASNYGALLDPLREALGLPVAIRADPAD